MKKLLIKNATLVNEGSIFISDVLISNNRIERIAKSITLEHKNNEVIEAEGLYLLPGMIDDQVHFREPGLTYKASLYSESKAAIAGGITSFMDMPNTIPNTLTLELLEEKYQLAQKNSLANYSFFMGINKFNLEEALRINNETVCGLSDDGLYFDNDEGILANYPDFLAELFSKTNSLVALHCEDDAIIKSAFNFYDKLHEGDISVKYHPLIRSNNACVTATKRVILLAEKFNTRLHILHVSTLNETDFFRTDLPLREKRITGEACVHHLWFSDEDYLKLGNKIKWNPSIKTREDKDGLLKALKEKKLDIIATDHAPHTLSEKEGKYINAKSGGPLVQHALPLMLELYHQGKISLEDIVEKTSHNVAEIYRIKDRGYLREGYFADMVIVDLNKSWISSQDAILYKCEWSPFDNVLFKSKIIKTFVNGNLIFDNGTFNENIKGKRLAFEKER
ncbi:MAG: dihydroorotase [Bacteroidota bacterium]|nr:dihydroorotase [Bacteroidota bacterium]MDP3145550.1 dihydroorotase [Bacteroidota bacterium]MDP3557982.1 dihydroorotase [Bacteroidota bacterium]